MSTMVLFRSGRHLRPAVAALRAAYPGDRLVVVAQPGMDGELDEAGVRHEDRLVFGKGRFSPMRFFFSRTGWEVVRLGLARVAVLWNDADGRGQANVTLTALMGRTAVIPVTPDGVLAPVGWRHVLCERTAPFLSWLAATWDTLRVRIEGPELEPPVWHSHYLALRLAERAIPAPASRLSGLVVDIGAGTGYARRFLDRRTTRYLPTDLPGGRDGTDATISRDGIRPRVYCSGDSLPFADATVDGVMASSVLEHVKDVPSILRDAYRVIRPGGRILLVTPFCFPFHGQPNDFRRWTDEGLAVELRACGFEPEQIELVGSTIASLVVNLHLAVKYEWREAPSVLLRVVSRWCWPLVLPWQAMTNLCAEWAERFEPRSRMPLGVVIVARRPA